MTTTAVKKGSSATSAAKKKPAKKRKPRYNFDSPLGKDANKKSAKREFRIPRGVYNSYSDTTRLIELSTASSDMTTTTPSYRTSISVAAKDFATEMKGRMTLKAWDCGEDDIEFEVDFNQFMLTMYDMAHELGVKIPAIPDNPHA